MIEVNGIQVKIIRKNIKNMYLGIYPPDGAVKVTAPTDTDDERVRLFVLTHFTRIKKGQQQIQEQPRLSSYQYIDRESHYFQGERYLLDVIDNAARNCVKLGSARFIELHIKPNTSTEQRHRLMMQWHRKELKLLIPPLIEKWEKAIGVNIAQWDIKQMKTKWGTCNIEKQRIWINLELSQKSTRCLEYIIVHEMLHLLVRHHNDEFLALMVKYLPNWKQIKKELDSSPSSHQEWGY